MDLVRLARGVRSDACFHIVLAIRSLMLELFQPGCDDVVVFRSRLCRSLSRRGQI